MSFPRYPNYKPSGVEWLGEVPEHWGLKPLWTLFRRLKRVGHETEQLLSVYRDHGVVTKASRDDNFNSPSEDLSTYQLVMPGDLVINKMKAWQGSVAISPERGIVSPAYFVYETLHYENSVFLHLLMRSVRYIVGYFTLSKGIRVNQWDLEPGYHSRIPLLLPPIYEQEQIVNFLVPETAKIDALVAEQQRLIELLKEKRQAVISHAVTKGLDPTVPMKPSGIEWLGDIPAHWTLVRIKHLACSIEQGWSPQCEGFPVETDTEWGVLKVGCVNGGIFNPLENKALPPELEPVPSLSISAGDLLVSRANTRELVGSSAVPQRNHPNLLLCDKIYRIKLHKERVLPEFVSYYLGCTPVRGQIELGATGASSSMVNIGQSIILELSIAIASTEEQSQILSSIQREIVKLGTLTAEAERAIELLQERRTALISAAVTGQIDVRQLAQGVAA